MGVRLMQHTISDAEWGIMQVLWESGATLTSAEIVLRVNNKRDRSPRTIKTLLQRLVAKGFVAYTVDDADSRVYHYVPKVSQEECIQRENQEFVSLYYKGDVGGMLARFIGDSDLSPEQIKELTALLNAKGEDTP